MSQAQTQTPETQELYEELYRNIIATTSFDGGNVVRGTMISVSKYNNKYYLIEWYSHTQTDVDIYCYNKMVSNDECLRDIVESYGSIADFVEALDISSIRIIGVYDDLKSLLKAVEELYSEDIYNELRMQLLSDP